MNVLIFFMRSFGVVWSGYSMLLDIFIIIEFVALEQCIFVIYRFALKSVCPASTKNGMILSESLFVQRNYRAKWSINVYSQNSSAEGSAERTDAGSHCVCVNGSQYWSLAVQTHFS